MIIYERTSYYINRLNMRYDIEFPLIEILHYFRFGDFISLRNEQSKKYLSLSGSTGILQGIVTKPLVPGNQNTDLPKKYKT